MKYIFIGGGKGGFELLNSAFKNNHFPEYAVICKEDAHENFKYSKEIKKLLNEHGIESSIKKKLADSDYIKIKNKNPDLIFVFGWRTMIDLRANSYCKYGLLAAHYSLLPKYRGFAPLQWALINGEKTTGVTLFFIEEGGVDSGKILIQKKVRIKSNDFAYDVERKLTSITVSLFNELISKNKLRKNSLKKQIELNATYTCKRIPEDGRINWEMNSEKVFNLVRALAYPYSGAFCRYENRVFEIRKAELIRNKIYSGRIPGRIVKIEKTGIEVLCGDGSIKISEWADMETGKSEIPSTRIRSYSDTLH